MPETPVSKRSLTFAGMGVEEAEAQLGLAAAMLNGLYDGFRESFDSRRNLSDRVREINEILAAAVTCMTTQGIAYSTG